VTDGAGAPPARAASPPARSRFTGRAATLVLVLAMLTVSYASSMRAYLQQRTHIDELRAQIADRESRITDLERQKQRWQDPAYLQQQARERFGYLLPGEKSFVVLDGNGDPLGRSGSLPDPGEIVKVEPSAWWTTAWASVQLAGDPPRAEPPPADQISAPAKKIRAGSG
jgi:cell division protein FtsB